MTSTFDEDTSFETRDDDRLDPSRDYQKEYDRVESRLSYVYSQISDYLHDEGLRDLLVDLTLTDLAAMIYDANYIRQLLPHVENKLI